MRTGPDPLPFRCRGTSAAEAIHDPDRHWSRRGRPRKRGRGKKKKKRKEERKGKGKTACGWGPRAFSETTALIPHLCTQRNAGPKKKGEKKNKEDTTSCCRYPKVASRIFCSRDLARTWAQTRGERKGKKKKKGKGGGKKRRPRHRN